MSDDNPNPNPNSIPKFRILTTPGGRKCTFDLPKLPDGFTMNIYFVIYFLKTLLSERKFPLADDDFVKCMFELGINGKGPKDLLLTGRLINVLLKNSFRYEDKESQHKFLCFTGLFIRQMDNYQSIVKQCLDDLFILKEILISKKRKMSENGNLPQSEFKKEDCNLDVLFVVANEARKRARV